MVFGTPSRLLKLTGQEISYVIISGITAIALAHVCFYAAMRRIGATIPSMINLLTPFSVLVLSGVFFGERLTAGQWIFGIGLVTGIALAVGARMLVFGPKTAEQTPLEE